MAYIFYKTVDGDSKECEQEDFMCGQSLATIIIAFIILIISAISTIIVCRNIRLKFSLFMILMIAFNAAANIANQIL